MPGDFAEIYQAMIGILTGDATLAALLGTPTQVYQDWPHLVPTFPALILKINSRPMAQLDVVGLWWPNVQIDVLGVDPVVQCGIEARLWFLLDRPRTNQGSVVTTNFSITEMFHVDTHEAGEITWQNTDQTVRRLATLWRMRVVKNNV